MPELQHFETRELATSEQADAFTELLAHHNTTPVDSPHPTTFECVPNSLVAIMFKAVGRCFSNHLYLESVEASEDYNGTRDLTVSFKYIDSRFITVINPQEF